MKKLFLVFLFFLGCGMKEIPLAPEYLVYPGDKGIYRVDLERTEAPTLLFEAPKGVRIISPSTQNGDGKVVFVGVRDSEKCPGSSIYQFDPSAMTTVVRITDLLCGVKDTSPTFGFRGEIFFRSTFAVGKEFYSYIFKIFPGSREEFIIGTGRNPIPYLDGLLVLIGYGQETTLDRVNIFTRATTQLSQSGEQIVNFAVLPDSRIVIAKKRGIGAFDELGIMNSDGTVYRTIFGTELKIRFDAETFTVNHDGSRLVAQINTGGKNSMILIDLLQGGVVRELPHIPLWKGVAFYPG